MIGDFQKMRRKGWPDCRAKRTEIGGNPPPSLCHFVMSSSRKQRAQSAPRAPGSEFRGRERPAELFGNLRQPPALEMVKRKQRAVIRRELRQNYFHLVGRCASRRIRRWLDRLRQSSVVRPPTGFHQPASANSMAAKIIPSGVRRDTEQPADKGLLRRPARQPADHAQKCLLYQIVEIRGSPHEAPQQPRHRGLVPHHEFLHRRPITVARTRGQVRVGIGDGGTGNRCALRFVFIRGMFRVGLQKRQ